MSCAICSDDIKDSVELECSHEFCRECIMEWFKQKHVCPICRASSEKFPDVVSLGIGFEYEDFTPRNNYNGEYDITDSSDSITFSDSDSYDDGEFVVDLGRPIDGVWHGPDVQRDEFKNAYMDLMR
jgi:hypothetical protein